MAEPVGFGRRASEKLRLPPHSVEAERSVLGGLMLDQRAWDQIADAVDAEDFYRADHRLIFNAIASLIEQDLPPDAITVSETLSRQGQLEAAGGLDYLAQLVEETPSAANIRAYARIVRERAMLRQLIQIGGDIAASAHDEEGRTVDELVDLAEQRVFEIADRGQKRGSGFIALKHILPKTIDRLDVLSHSEGDITGISTGFGDMDKMTAGLQRGDLIIVAGRPSMGKCIVTGSRLIDPATGRLETIDRRVREERGELVSLNRRGRLQAAKASAFVDDGLKPVYEVRTALGRRIAVTASHPFLTMRGWQPLAALQSGAHIGVPRVLPFFGKRRLPESLVKLAAYFLTSGARVDPEPAFTHADARIRQDFADAVGHLPAVRCRTETNVDTGVPTVTVVRNPALSFAGRPQRGARLRRQLLDAQRRALRTLAGVAGVAGATRCQVAAAGAALAPGLGALDVELDDHSETAAAATGGADSVDPIVRWLATLGLPAGSAHELRVPDAIFELSKDQLALFLNRVFACDGRVSAGNYAYVDVSYVTASEQLARDLQHLLLRFGIVAALRPQTPCDPAAAYELHLVRGEDVARFVREIGLFGREAAVAAYPQSAPSASTIDADLVPADVWALIEAKQGAGTSKSPEPYDEGRGASQRALSREGLKRIADALDDDELRNLATSDIYWDRIESIRFVGERQVYDLTVPEHHNFVAEDVIVHNTTFAMNIAENAAIGGNVPVAVFSMEMSAEQLSFRMIGSIGRVNQQHLRTGRLTDEDWSRIESAVSMMSNAPIFIDDSAGLTPTEVRARARRLKRESGLGLVVVDYLQLMQVSGTTENRATEISEISRSLKALAKELDVPVIALSQLNRSVEQRADKKPVMSDLRECVTGDTPVWLADGRRVPVRSLVGKRPEVWSIDEHQRLVRARADKVWRVGTKPVFRVELASGRTIRATAEHRLLAGGGWKTVAELASGDRLALARHIPQPASAGAWPEHRLVLLAHLVGVDAQDGEPLRYTSECMASAAAVELAAEALGCRVTRPEREDPRHLVLIEPPEQADRSGGICAWLAQIGVIEEHVNERALPEAVFTLADPHVALLLRHLWAASGAVTLRKQGGRAVSRVSFATASRALARDVAALLLRLGIVAQIRTVLASASATYAVDVVGLENQLRFVHHIGGFGRQSEAIAELDVHLQTIEPGPSVDTLPAEVLEVVHARMAERGIADVPVARAQGAGSGPHATFAPSRGMLAAYAYRLGAPDLAVWAESDLFWDRVLAIVPDGEEEVFDLTVPGCANWLADGIVTHNSGAIEQDADLIVFIYREEVYEPDTPRKGIADIIIAKQRNGPVGEFHLTFLGEFTKFENLVAEAYGEGVF